MPKVLRANTPSPYKSDLETMTELKTELNPILNASQNTAIVRGGIQIAMKKNQLAPTTSSKTPSACF